MTTRSFLFLFFLMTACRSSSSSGHSIPSPETTDAPSPVIESGRAVWTIPTRTIEQRFISTTASSIETTTPQGIRRDTVTLSASFRTAFTRGSPATYSARLESLSSREATPDLPLVFAGRIESGRVTVEPAVSPAGCTNPAHSAMPVILRSLVIVPSQLSRGMSWTDSTISSICSGPVPVTLVSIRTYRVTGEKQLGNQQALLLEQQLTTRFSGEGVEGQHRIRIAGEGTGKGQVHLDPSTGELIDSTLDHTSTITVTASGRDQRFTQQSRESIRRVQ